MVTVDSFKCIFLRMKGIKINTRPSLLLFAIIAVFVHGCNDAQEKNKATEAENTSNESVSPQKGAIPGKTVLVGDWTRTDAPYQIKITELLNDGTMKAGYYNPKSINVSSAMWAFADGVLKIFIELRDENYPGSNYNLIYYPEGDLLAGKYFQAVERVTYDVGFARAKYISGHGRLTDESVR
jgi:hypothetical protein